MIHARQSSGKEVGELRRIGTGSWPSRRNPRRIGGGGLAFGGAVLIFKAFPFWIWPFGIGLWLMWAGLAPVVAGTFLIWLGWRLALSGGKW